jgi:uncharacterized protein YcbK (DUF882 family)
MGDNAVMLLRYDTIGTIDRRIGRRRFLKLGAFISLAGITPRRALAVIQNHSSPERSLSFYETHTKESLTTVYRAKGRYLPEALADINHILRDFRTSEIKAIDPCLLDLLYEIGVKLGCQKPFHVISGYRSPETNALLNKRNKGVAKNSLHVHGKAVDVRLPGCSLSVLRDVAMNLKGGGVGYYSRSNFVHIDVGHVRYW